MEKRALMKLNKKLKTADAERDLKLAISAGDEQSFELLYNEYNKRLLSFAKLIVKSKELAEEIVEDVFVKLWCNRETIPAINGLRLYLYTATKNHSLNTLAKKSNRITTSSIELLELDFYTSFSDPHDQLITSEMMKKMQMAIEELPDRCKLIFKLVREDGLKYKEVSEILDISVNTIDNQMAIAVKRICSALNISKDRIVQ